MGVMATAVQGAEKCILFLLELQTFGPVFLLLADLDYELSPAATKVKPIELCYGCVCLTDGGKLNKSEERSGAWR